MSDDEIDAELLALVDDEDASEAEDKMSPESNKSKSLPASPAPGPKSAAQAAPKGVARPKLAPATTVSKPKSRSQEESEEEGEASSAPSPQNSLGSGAMSESDSEGPASKDHGVLFPVDGIFRSEKEKAQINAMPEIQRERLLAERAEEAEQLAQSAKLRELMQRREDSAVAQKKRKATSADLEDSPRKSSRAKTKQSENLAAYKRQREQRHEQRKLGDARKARDKKSPSQEDAISDAEGDAESDVEWDDSTAKTPAARDEPPPGLNDFERVRVGRSNFAKVCFSPGFDKAIQGCYARVSIGINKATGQNTYRMTAIKAFVQGRPYKMEASNGRTFYTDQYAILCHGKSEKEWPFIACSDSPFTEGELYRYMQTLQEEGMRVPIRSSLVHKCADIQNLLDHRWTDEQVSTKMRRMKEVSDAASSIEREKLEKQRKIAQANGNESEMARFDQEIARLGGDVTTTQLPTRNGGATSAPLNAVGNRPLTQQERLAALNRQNRKANAEEIRKAQIEEKKRAVELQREALARGEVISNPFARVKTRARVHHDASSGDTLTPSARKRDDLFGEGSDISRAGTPANGNSRAGTPTPGVAKPSSAPKNNGPVGKGEKVGVGGVTKTVMDDDVLGAMDLGIEIDI